MFGITITIRVGRPDKRSGPSAQSPSKISTAICTVCGRPGSARGWAGHLAALRHGGWIPLEHEHGADEIREALDRRPSS
jgi:hypothetical protein